MNDTLTEDDMDVFESLFNADGKWVLVDTSKHKLPHVIGPFHSAEEAKIFKDRTPILFSYHIIEIVDPEDVIRKHNEQSM